jgi:hypothetical protein
MLNEMLQEVQMKNELEIQKYNDYDEDQSCPHRNRFTESGRHRNRFTESGRHRKRFTESGRHRNRFTEFGREGRSGPCRDDWSWSTSRI